VRAALLAVGDELLAGEHPDANSPELARRLLAVGIPVVSVQVVPDQEEEIERAVRRGLAEAELVIATGGLGPTLDDVTRQGIARALGRGIAESEAALTEVRAWYERRGIPMPAANRRQALLPEGAALVKNRAGTAPGLCVEAEGRVVFALPGPPHEMQVVLEQEVLPWLAANGRSRAARGERRFHLFGLSESVFAGEAGEWMARDADPLIGCTVKEGTMTIVLRAASDAPGSLRALDERAAAFRERFGRHVFSTDDPRLERALGEECIARGIAITTAESCTGGLVAALLTGVPGISAVFAQGFVTYGDGPKERWLEVPRALFERHGAVSREVAEAMALGAARAAGAELALAVTGIAGPGGGSAAKPVGLVCFATALRGALRSEERRFAPTDRESIRAVAARTALFLGWKRLCERD
jgi:nicotinamide-nucleotide amidase